MGNSESHGAAAAAGAIEGRIKKEKKRAKRLGCCCCWCNVGAIVAFVVGIVLLVYFASSLGDNYDPNGKPKQDAAKGLTYTGIAFLILGALLLISGILFAVGLYIAYRRLNGKSSSGPNFVPKKYAKGTAPYPQQDWGDSPDPHEPAASPVAPQQATAPEDSSANLITAEIN